MPADFFGELEYRVWLLYSTGCLSIAAAIASEPRRCWNVELTVDQCKWTQLGMLVSRALATRDSISLLFCLLSLQTRIDMILKEHSTPETAPRHEKEIMLMTAVVDRERKKVSR